MKDTTYTIVQRNPNSWSVCDGKTEYEYVRDCGHRHRKLSAAERCLEGLSRRDESGFMSELGYFGQIEDAEGNTIE